MNAFAGLYFSYELILAILTSFTHKSNRQPVLNFYYQETDISIFSISGCCGKIQVMSTGEALRDQPLYIGIYTRQAELYNGEAVYVKTGGGETLYTYFFISETHGVSHCASATICSMACRAALALQAPSTKNAMIAVPDQ